MAKILKNIKKINDIVEADIETTTVDKIVVNREQIKSKIAELQEEINTYQQLLDALEG